MAATKQVEEQVEEQEQKAPPRPAQNSDMTKVHGKWMPKAKAKKVSEESKARFAERMAAAGLDPAKYPEAVAAKK